MENDQREQPKIPYDNEPIFRPKTRSAQQPVVAGASKPLKLAVLALSVLSVVFVILFGVLFYRSNAHIGISGRHTTKYVEHNTISNGAITDTAVNIALRSSVMIESHTTDSLSTHDYIAGAGVILSDVEDKVVIVTNYHVCLDVNNRIADYIYVLLYNYVNVDNSTSFYASSRIRCTYVGGSYNEDVAVIYFDRAGHAEELYSESGAMPATIADSAQVAFGDSVFAIGNPSGKGTSVTFGVVSRPTAWSTVDVNSDRINETIRSIQIDATVNPGNSGGGLFDVNGNWIGIVESKLSSLANTNFAIPSNEAYGVAWNIIANDGKFKMVKIVNIETVSRVVENDEGAIEYYYDLKAKNSANGILEGDIFEQMTYIHPDKGEITVDLHKPYAVQEQLLFLKAGDVVTFKLTRPGQSEPEYVQVTIDENQNITHRK